MNPSRLAATRKRSRRIAALSAVALPFVETQTTVIAHVEVIDGQHRGDAYRPLTCTWADGVDSGRRRVMTTDQSADAGLQVRTWHSRDREWAVLTSPTAEHRRLGLLTSSMPTGLGTREQSEHPVGEVRVSPGPGGWWCDDCHHTRHSVESGRPSDPWIRAGCPDPPESVRFRSGPRTGVRHRSFMPTAAVSAAARRH